MELTTLIVIGIALIENLILYYLGRILTQPEQLRSFLGLDNNELENHKKTSIWVKNIGNLIMLLAIINIIINIVTTFNVLE